MTVANQRKVEKVQIGTINHQNIGKLGDRIYRHIDIIHRTIVAGFYCKIIYDLLNTIQINTMRTVFLIDHLAYCCSIDHITIYRPLAMQVAGQHDAAGKAQRQAENIDAGEDFLACQVSEDVFDHNHVWLMSLIIFLGGMGCEICLYISTFSTT